MRVGTTHWLLVGLLCLGLWPMVAASDQETRWDSIMADAVKAYQQADYAQAEKLLLAALKEAEKFGNQDPRLATSLNNLAELYRAQGNYEQAEPLHQRALAIWEKALGPEHLDVGASLNNLAGLYHAQGNYAEAEKFFRAALKEAEKFGNQDPRLATSLNNLAGLYRAQSGYAQAEPLQRRALAILEKTQGPEHPNVASSLNNLAELYREQGKYEQAKPLAAWVVGSCPRATARS